ncbi:MAG: hypothetical protein HF978_16230 [Desulfobacteraceae bacterium]|nr:hypothetical protein [Desulfobacteraceae bacterium]MBC2757091.1 hypothetical protein [Desulfobacteraceae bacterium]MBC2763693.1 hypothetical protein [ANME-2 cluster archaeon]
MPYKLIGTLIALFFYGCTLNFSTIILTPGLADAQMSELSEIQNGIFYLSHKNMGITSETFKTDKYIDYDQAEYFSLASKPKVYTPADDNYPFTLVDHYILDSDLAIEYKYNSILCSAYPPKAYLSRHNISIADYTDQASPPAVYMTTIEATEPFRGEDVKAVVWIINNYEYHQSEHIIDHDFQNGPYENMANCGIDAYLIDTTIRVSSGMIAVWVHHSPPFPYCPPPVKPCIDCLPESYCPKPVFAQVKWISPDAWNCRKPTPRPKSNCVIYPPSPETESTPNANPNRCITCK